MTKKWFKIGKYEQWVELKNGEIDYNCTCVHGSIWRFGKKKTICWHGIKAIEIFKKDMNMYNIYKNKTNVLIAEKNLNCINQKDV